METKYIRYNVAWPPLPGIIGTTGSHQSVWNMSRRTTCLLAASRQIASQLATRLKRTTYDEDNMSPFDATLTSDNRSTIYIISITQQCSFQIKQPDTSTSDNTQDGYVQITWWRSVTVIKIVSLRSLGRTICTGIHILSHGATGWSISTND